MYRAQCGGGMGRSVCYVQDLLYQGAASLWVRSPLPLPLLTLLLLQ